MEAIGITGFGVSLPAASLSNEQIAESYGYDPADHGGKPLAVWAEEHHGGLRRFLVSGGECTSTLGALAAERALHDAGLEARDIDLLLMVTATSDHVLSPTAAAIQGALDLRCKFIQLESACTGFLDGLETSASLLSANRFTRCLMVAADVTDWLIAPNDWLSRSVFGDAGVAVVLEPVSNGGFGPFVGESEGALSDWVRVPGLGSGAAASDEPFVRLAYKNIGPWAVERMAHWGKAAANAAGWDISEVDWLVPHQPASSIVRAVAESLGIRQERCVATFQGFGNTVTSALGLALATIAPTAKPGDRILMTAAGAGMASGAVCYTWPGVSLGAMVHEHLGLEPSPWR